MKFVISQKDAITGIEIFRFESKYFVDEKEAQKKVAEINSTDKNFQYKIERKKL